MHHFEEADESTAKQLHGIIADLIVDFTSVAFSAPDGSSAAGSLHGLVKTPVSYTHLTLPTICSV